MIDYDVVVCGAGPSGVAAALSAARNGAHTLLLEKYGFGGGSSTAALVYPWMSFHSNRGEQVIGGVAQEIVTDLIRRGGSPGHLRDTIGFAYSVTPFNYEVYKILIDDLLAEAGVSIAYHTEITRVETGDGRIQELISPANGNEAHFHGKIYVDSSGDGDIATSAGVPFQNGRNSDGRSQPMSMNFVMGGVDLDQVISYMRNHPQDFHPGSLIDELDHLPLTAVSGFFSIWKRFAPPEIPRDRMLFFIGVHPGEVIVNTTRLLNFDGRFSSDLTKAEIEGRWQVKLVAEFCQRYLPGFSDAYLIQTPTQVGVRETRHVAGMYTLTASDIVNARKFPDCIARNGFPIDVHDPEGSSLASDRIAGDQAYDIPYRCLLPQGVDNLLINGRCASTTHTASASMRLTPSCMAIGQAVGTAAALAVRKGCPPAEVEIHELKSLLRAQHAILD
jgi:hypothetical protein